MNCGIAPGHPSKENHVNTPVAKKPTQGMQVMKRIIAACIVATVFSVNGKTFETDDEFSIILPDGWVQIPGSVLQGFSAKMDELSPDTPRQVYDYGYQIDKDGTWLAYPYILVQVRSEGRIPSGQLARYNAFAPEMEEDINKVKEGFSDILSDASMDEPVYDSENKILWTSFSANVLDGDDVKALVGMRLTEMGYIQLTGYAPMDSFAEYERIFRDAFGNLVLSADIEYQPQFSDTAPVIGGFNTAKLMVFVVQAVLIGGVLWLVYIRIKRLVRKGKA